MSSIDPDPMAFEFSLPVWFVLAEDFTELDQEHDCKTIETVESKAFMGGFWGSSRCVLVFTDNDLAQRAVSEHPGANITPAAVYDKDTLAAVLMELLHQGWFQGVLVETTKTGTRSNRQWTLQGFIDIVLTPD
jgi:hypothetical protein